VITEGQPTAGELAEYTRRLREYEQQMASAIRRARVFTQVNNEAAQSVRDLQAELDQFSGGGLVSALAETRDVLGEFNTSVGKLEDLADGEAAGR
jgi:hypothetical protein